MTGRRADYITTGAVEVAVALVLLARTLTACSTAPGDDRPVSDSVLVAVLADLHILEAVRQMQTSDDTLFIDYDSLDAAIPGTRDSVLSAHGLDEATFMRAMDPFLKDPPRYVSLYNRVLDNLIQRGRSDFSQGR